MKDLQLDDYLLPIDSVTGQDLIRLSERLMNPSRREDYLLIAEEARAALKNKFDLFEGVDLQWLVGAQQKELFS